MDSRGPPCVTLPSDPTRVDLSPVISGATTSDWPAGQVHHQPSSFRNIAMAPAWASDLKIIWVERHGDADAHPAHMKRPSTGPANAHYWGDLTLRRSGMQPVGEVYRSTAGPCWNRRRRGLSFPWTVGAEGR